MKIGIWRTIGRHEAAGIDLVLAVELHQLFVLPRAVVLPLLLDLLHLRRVRLEVLHRVDLPHGDRHEHEPDEDDERHDRPRPGEPDRGVEPLEEAREEILDRPQRVEDGDHVVGSRVSGSRKRRRSRTWSTPPWLHGIAAEQPPPRDDRPADEAELAEGLEGVRGAARVVLAGAVRRQHARRSGASPGRARSDPPHAVTFPTTSATCSTSHAWPRDSAASASPGRAAST